MNSVNSDTLSLMSDRWCFEVPLSLKPNFLNMNLDLNLLQASDFINGHSWNFEALGSLLGVNLNSEVIENEIIDPSSEHAWVWFPSSHSNKLSSNFIISCLIKTLMLSIGEAGNFFGSSTLPLESKFSIGWPCKVGSRPTICLILLTYAKEKTVFFVAFIWKLLSISCIIYCPKFQLLKTLVEIKTGIHFQIRNGYYSGNWLEFTSSNSDFIKACYIVVMV